MCIRLSTLLFEAGGLTNYAPPEFCLLKVASFKGLVLVHTNTLLSLIKPQKKITQTKLLDVLEHKEQDWLCAMAISYETRRASCSGAMEINNVAANPKFPGAGSTIYACMSKCFRKPIISDRNSSTSDSAKKAWSRIENSPEWKKVPMDGYMDDPWEGGKTYFDSEGSWPNRIITPRTGPKTPPTKDDCPAPQEADGDWQELDAIMGTADAWLYIGKINTTGLLRQGQQLLEAVTAASGITLSSYHITELARTFFSSRYKGVSG